MRYLPLGFSQINASVVGLGTWGIGGWMWGGVDQDHAVRAIHAALDHGVNLIDTAPIYGFGLSESLVGRAIQDRRDDVVLATKCGMVANTTQGDLKFRADVTGPTEHGHIGIYIHLDPRSIRKEVEASLARLRTDYIDLYQTHWQEQTTPIEQTMGELMRLKEEGKIRAIGVCNATSEQMQTYRRHGTLDSDQEKFSLLDRDIEADQLPYCREQNVAVLAYSPLAKGLLTGKIDPQAEFDAGDSRADESRFQPDNIASVNRMLEAMRPVAEEHGISLTQLIIAWTLHQPGLTHALCGARSPEHATANAEAGDIQLSEDHLQLLDTTYEDYRAAAVESVA